MRRWRRIEVLTLTVLWLDLAAATACEPAPIGKDAARIRGKDVVLDWRIEPAPLRIGEFFAVVVSACERSARRLTGLKVDATMPAHKHGMNYLPTVTAAGGGTFRAHGLLLHMPGRWEFSFDVASAASRETLRASVELQ